MVPSGLTAMGKKSKRYEAQKKDARRKAKRALTKKATQPFSNIHAEEAADQRAHVLPLFGAGSQGEWTTASEHPDTKEAKDMEVMIKQSKENITLLADHNRVCGMLYEKQRKPHKIYMECGHCLEERQLKAALAEQSLKARMLSGESYGSRQLLAALT